MWDAGIPDHMNGKSLSDVLFGFLAIAAESGFDDGELTSLGGEFWRKHPGKTPNPEKWRRPDFLPRTVASVREKQAAKAQERAAIEGEAPLSESEKNKRFHEFESKTGLKLQEVVLYDGDHPRYRMGFSNGREIELSPTELLSPRAFRAKAYPITNIPCKIRKQDAWDELLERIAPCIRRERIDEMKLSELIKENLQEENADVIDNKSDDDRIYYYTEPMTFIESGTLWIKAPKLARKLNIRCGLNLDRGTVARQLRAMGATRRSISYRADNRVTSVKVWGLPVSYAAP
ncbi:hypothetical protein DSCOOX_52450 [Desulfosarcina ovata subsp. ovata]|uniref:Uncharacterized protein n=2 Tax=Desulfosarcina ovata TaxID=83564 RepID=A0A5K8AHB0_9BACT|nr:hypothetical protein DSCOOX_52450 [Desulfosarcina ovata subsp. ovata]